MQANRVVSPARLHSMAAARSLANEAEITQAGDAWQVQLRDSGLNFFWPSEPDQNLHFVIEQEFSAANPHHYTTAPIRLSQKSTVFDVGACEGAAVGARVGANARGHEHGVSHTTARWLMH